MTKSEVIKTVLDGKKPPYVPWSFKFTKEPLKMLQEHYNDDDLDPVLGNHILNLGSDIGFFDEIPRELDDAAMVDGASRLTVLVRIMLPLVRPGLIVAGIFAAIFIWNELLVGSYLIQSQSLKTIPLAAGGLITAQRPIDWNVAATVGVVTIIPIFIFSLFTQRYISRGITAGALK